MANKKTVDIVLEHLKALGTLVVLDDSSIIIKKEEFKKIQHLENRLHQIKNSRKSAIKSMGINIYRFLIKNITNEDDLIKIKKYFKESLAITEKELNNEKQN